MEVDSATSAIQNPVAKHLLPELEIYCYLLVLLFLIDQKRYDAVESISVFLYFYQLCQYAAHYMLRLL